MALLSRFHVAALMEFQGIIPLFYHSDPEICKKVLKACYEGGSRILEFTARGDFAHETFSELNKYALQNLPEMCLGVGSVTDAAAASLYMQMGANFIVTPSFREDIAIVCNRRKILWLPGCGSLQEINRAEELGCEIVKLFPGDIYGPRFIKAIKGPQPWTSVMPTGGVEPTKESLEEWLSAGAYCLGLGSKLISKQIVNEENYEKLSEKVAEALNFVKEIKDDFRVH